MVGKPTNKKTWRSMHYQKFPRRILDCLPSITLFSLSMFFLIVSTGCQQISQLPTSPTIPLPSPSSTGTVVSTPLTADLTNVQPTAEQVLSTPTLAPTATPSPLDYAIDNLSRDLGISDQVILGLRAADFLDLLFSLAIILLGSLVGMLLINGIRWLLKFTPTNLDEQILNETHRQVKWLISLFLLEFATARLTILTPEIKQWLNLVYFTLYVIVISSLIWRLVAFGLQDPLLRASSPQNRGLLITFTPLLRRTLQFAIISISLAIILQNFGVNLSALIAILGLGGLAISLAAKETLEDMINGFIILIDRPYQVGDRIKIETMDAWGDVESIGSRTTRIRTLDNRLVIVPNSIIGRNQVENYTYPDPSYRAKIKIGIAYGTDLDRVEEIIIPAVLQVPGVLQDKAPMVELKEFGDSAIILCVHYWLDAYANILVRSSVHKAILKILEDENIEMPFITYDVNLDYKDLSPASSDQKDPKD